ncbi:MAG TPA: diguanylate cyclase [Steroidobacteraceae bacterium]|nr:diguanylate cyclase [Steroidobacteraceae bacterium]
MGLAGTARAADQPHPAQALIDRAWAGARTDPDASSRDAYAALEMLGTRPDVDLEIRARLLLCEHLSERDQAAAEQQAARARELLPKAARHGLQAGVLTCEGTIRETAGDNASARELYERAVQVATETTDEEMLAGALFSRGYLQGVQGQYAAGLTDLKRAQSVFEDIDLPDHALTALNAIAILYNRMGDYAQAIHIYERALTAQRSAGMRREEAVTLHNLGRAHENLLEWDAADKSFQESLTISRELSYPRGEAYALRGLGAVANAKGDPQGALRTLERAGALQRQTPDARLHAQIQLARGIALHRLGKWPASVDALEQALAVFKEADSLTELRATYAELAAVLADQGSWRDAYAHLASAKETAERQFQNQIDQRFTTLKVEFDTAGKEQENALLIRENEANQKALAQERRARRLQAAVIVLTAALAVLLATLAVHQWRTTRRMRTLAMTDELTGVPNRRAVLTRLAPLVETPNGRGHAMLIIDIDHFKSINDQYGHPEGDEALKLVAARLRAEVHEPAFIGRLGGEEFVVVLPDAAADAGQQLAERFRESVQTIDTRRWLADRRLTVSIGMTVSKAAGDTPSHMLQRADAALYEAKRAGRNCVRQQLPPAAPGATTTQSPGESGLEYA